jgi:predicted GNAT family acetyltransferase
MGVAVHIEKQDSGSGGRYVARVDGRDGTAQLLFTRRRPGLISADHTEAPVSLQGTGVAKALVEYVIADARATHFKIAPVCPYVLGEVKKHPEWGDVIVAATAAWRPPTAPALGTSHDP